ncbi:Interferon-induced GTP-binding protein Mx, partial [Apaloderma vittatum]
QTTEHPVYRQYVGKVRPCIDLIDSLRALGIEKDLALPTIAVIGDQNSGKRSILEALSGVALPRGDDNVTPCPLELKLKRIPATQAWKGKICFCNASTELQDASEVKEALRKVQNAVTPTKSAISEELISLEIQSPQVPDLTLIDLPGIVRTATGKQPKDIGIQIKTLLKKTIGCKETLNLVVVPCNVDIAATEAMKMAQEVDPSGERTLGILTKPDLMDRGSEEIIMNIMRNLVLPLKKGYMMVKCGGQQGIYNKPALADAIRQEREFFQTHRCLSILLEEERATIPHLAEKLTNELVRHIIETLPTLKNQIHEGLQKTLQALQKYRTPKTDSEKLIFLTDVIKLFNQDISQTICGEEQLFGNEISLFAKICKVFQMWETLLLECVEKVEKNAQRRTRQYEDQCHGWKHPAFVNYRTFENIIKEHIVELEEPAILIMNNVIGLIEEKFIELAKRHFANFASLIRAAKTRIEDIKQKQTAEAERQIRTQFKMERLVYCQDDLYSNDLKSLKAENTMKVGNEKELQVGAALNQEPTIVQDMVFYTKVYFDGATKRLSSQIPLIILSFALHDFGDKLQTTMLHLLEEFKASQDSENKTLNSVGRFELRGLLQKGREADEHRNCLGEQVNRFTKACQCLRAFNSL